MARSLVLVRSSAHVGGIEHFILDLAEFLTRRGWNVGLIFLYRSPQGVSKTRAEERPIHPAVAMARARGLRAYSIPDRAAWDVRPLLALRALLASISPPPLVHTHDYKSDILVTLTRPRYHIATAHGFTDADARQKFYRHLDTLILHRLPLVITPSSSQARTLERYGIKATRLRVIPPAPNWARLMREARRPLPSPAQYDVDAGPVFSFVGRCSPERQGALLLKAFARVAREGPRARLWIVGDGPARAAWEALATRLGFRSSVRFWRWRQDVAAFIRRSTFMVNPTRVETLGLATVEALGLGTPVIATPALDLRSEPWAKGILWAEGMGLEDLAEAMMRGLERATAWREQAAAHAPPTRAAFSLEKALQAHENIYLEM